MGSTSVATPLAFAISSIAACNPVAPRQSSICHDRQNAFLIVAAFPSRLSRYIF
jgi:hypothetical protein